MSLLDVLQSEIVTVLMKYLDSSRYLLEIAKPLQSSFVFAWEAAAHREFNFFKFSGHLRGDPLLCRRAVERVIGSENHFDRLWSSIPETIITVDFLGFACSFTKWAYKYVPLEVKDDIIFIRSLVNYTNMNENWIPIDWIPDSILAEDRELAMICAKKALYPFGSRGHFHLDDKEIVEIYLKTTCSRFEPILWEKIRRFSPWCNREWILDMCHTAPWTAALFLNQIALEAHSSELQEEIIKTIPSNLVYSTFRETNNRHAIWRAALRRDPAVIKLLDAECQVTHLDHFLLTSVFREKPVLYLSCQREIRSLEFVARVVFAKDGLHIRDSPFVNNRKLVMISVGQNGLALKHVDPRFQNDLDVVMTAVQQNGMALKWATRRLQADLNVVMAAVQQNGLALAWVLLDNPRVVEVAVLNTPAAADFIKNL
jgi:hypothetical protein